MAENKTQPTGVPVEEFLAAVEHPGRRADSFELLGLMRSITGQEAVMWGPSIVGFGSYHYRYASGRKSDWMALGFAPRKGRLTLYLMDGFGGYEELLARLGKHSTGKSCLHVKRLQDVDLDVLREMVRRSYRDTTERAAG